MCHPETGLVGDSRLRLRMTLMMEHFQINAAYSVRCLMSEAMPDLNPIAERIVAVNRMSALLVPGNLGRIRSPVIFFAVELFENRRIELRRDTKIDMRPFDRARAALGDLIDSMQISPIGRCSARSKSPVHRPGTCVSFVNPKVSQYQDFP